MSDKPLTRDEWKLFAELLGRGGSLTEIATATGISYERLLTEIENEAVHGDSSVNPAFVAEGARRLVGEIRRLRSDEWLRAVDEEIVREARREGVKEAHAMYCARTERYVSEDEFQRILLHDPRAHAEATAAAQRCQSFGRAVIKILRKHRDGTP